MAYVINDSCVSCGACESSCPVSAISAGDSKYEIDPNMCIDCGTCVETCPTGSIESEQIDKGIANDKRHPHGCLLSFTM